jgi:multiple sugar transport system substrate-binding protein
MNTILKRRWRSIFTLLTIIPLLFASTGCSKDSASGNSEEEALTKDVKATISVLNWGNPQEAKAYNEAIKRFNKKYPNVKVINNLTPVASWSDYVDKWVTQVASGESPDVINIAIEGAQLAADKKLLLPLNDYIEADAGTKEHFNQIPKPLSDAFNIKGSQYLVPNGWQTMVVYYNTKIFEEKGIEPPKENWTWEEFLATAQKLTYGEGSNKVYGFGLPWGFFQLSPWWITNGTNPITEDYAKGNLTDPKFIESIGFIKDLVQKYKVSPDPIGIDVYSQFPAGKVAMIGAGRWPLTGWQKSGFQDYKAVPWPIKSSSGTVFGSAGWGISSSTKNKDLSWELIKEFESTETLKQTMDIGQQLPALESLSKEASFLESSPGNSELLWSVIDNAKPVASPIYFRDLEQILMRNLETVMSGSKTPEQAMKDAEKELGAVTK